MFLIVKAIFQKIILYIINHWQVILMACLSLYALNQKMRYAAIMNEFNAYKSEVLHQSQLQQQKSDILRKNAEKVINDQQKVYENSLKAIKNEYIKKQNLADISIIDLRDRLQSAISNSNNLPNFKINSEATSEEWRNNYATIARQYEILKNTCAITTLDYNNLRFWADASCEQVGCTD